MNRLKKATLKDSYNRMLERVKTKPYYTDVDLTNRLNTYTCAAGHVTTTKDIHAGTTPMVINCPLCLMAKTPVLSAYSAMYRPTKVGKVSIEWYRPEWVEFEKLHPMLMRHVLDGGLLLRPVNADE